MGLDGLLTSTNLSFVLVVVTITAIGFHIKGHYLKLRLDEMENALSELEVEIDSSREKLIQSYQQSYQSLRESHGKNAEEMKEFWMSQIQNMVHSQREKTDYLIRYDQVKDMFGPERALNHHAEVVSLLSTVGLRPGYYKVTGSGTVTYISRDKAYKTTVRTGVKKVARLRILERDGYRCQLCGVSPRTNEDVSLEVDHKFPVARGGDNDEDNLWTLCFDCNQGKKDRVMELPEDLNESKGVAQ